MSVSLVITGGYGKWQKSICNRGSKCRNTSANPFFYRLSRVPPTATCNNYSLSHNCPYLPTFVRGMGYDDMEIGSGLDASAYMARKEVQSGRNG